MLKIIRKLASLKFTLVGMVLFVIGSAMSYGNPDETPVWVLIVPMLLLSINLTCAIATNSRINQQPGLLLFHVSLLLIVILAAVGRMTHMDAHLEIVNGTEFSESNLLELKAGPWHNNHLEKVKFVQGRYTVQYAPGLRRGLTHSYVSVQQPSGEWQDQVVGDDRPMVIEGYRFYTTFNKGFSPVLSWIPHQGAPVTGTVNMPSYPLFEYKQDNRWVPPGTNQEIKFWLQLQTGMTLEEAWVLDGRTATGVLVVTTDKGRQELKVGESVDLGAGKLKFQSLTTWMGYRLFYDPTIQWLFFISVAGILGLSHYFWRKINLQPWMSEIPDPLLDENGDSKAENKAENKADDNGKPSDNLGGQTTTGANKKGANNDSQPKQSNSTQIATGDQH